MKSQDGDLRQATFDGFMYSVRSCDPAQRRCVAVGLVRIGKACMRLASAGLGTRKGLQLCRPVGSVPTRNVTGQCSQKTLQSAPSRSLPFRTAPHDVKLTRTEEVGEAPNGRFNSSTQRNPPGETRTSVMGGDLSRSFSRPWPVLSGGLRGDLQRNAYCRRCL